MTLSITNVTATEYKSAYGRVSATAKKKALQLYTYGINRCLELIIFQEEQIFRKSLAYESGIKYPELPEEPDDKALEKYDRAKARYEQKIDKLLLTKQLKSKKFQMVFLVLPRTVIELSSGVGWVLCMKIQHRINSTSLFSPETCKS